MTVPQEGIYEFLIYNLINFICWLTTKMGWAHCTYKLTYVLRYSNYIMGQIKISCFH